MADTAVTISPKKVFIESNPERLNGATIRYNIKSADVAYGSGSTDTVTMTLGTTAAFWVVSRAFALVQTAFAGTGGLSIQVGVTGTTNAFLAATSVLSAGLIQPSTGLNTVNTVASAKGTSAATIKAVFTNSVSDSPSALTAGEVDVYLNLLDLSRLA